MPLYTIKWNIPTKLNLKQQIKFMNGIYTIFEASFSRFAPDSVWKWGEPTPVLLTNNMKLYNMFFDTNSKQAIVEKYINAYGMEHLIEVIPLDRVDESGNITKTI